MSPLGNTKCSNWANYPQNTKGTTGGFLGINVIVCGGLNELHEHSDECRIVAPKTTKLLTNMLSKRFDAASLIIKGKYLWVSGGNNGGGTLSSTEFIDINIGTTAGPELPTALEGHKMIDITDDLTIVIGGSFAGIEKSTTYKYKYKSNHQEGHWSDGPTMQYRRRNHAVGVVTDRITLKKFLVVTGGVSEEGTLMSSEILFGDSWSKGEIEFNKAY